MKGGVNSIFTDFPEPTFSALSLILHSVLSIIFSHSISNDYSIFTNGSMQLMHKCENCFFNYKTNNHILQCLTSAFLHKIPVTVASKCQG